MKVKEFIEKLKNFNQEANILVSSDEELNDVFFDIQAEYLEDRTQVVIWGNSGSGIYED